MRDKCNVVMLCERNYSVLMSSWRWRSTLDSGEPDVRCR